MGSTGDFLLITVSYIVVFSFSLRHTCRLLRSTFFPSWTSRYEKYPLLTEYWSSRTNTFGPLHLEAMYVNLNRSFAVDFTLTFPSQAGSIHVRVRRDANEQVRK